MYICVSLRSYVYKIDSWLFNVFCFEEQRKQGGGGKAERLRQTPDPIFSKSIANGKRQPSEPGLLPPRLVSDKGLVQQQVLNVKRFLSLALKGRK